MHGFRWRRQGALGARTKVAGGAEVLGGEAAQGATDARRAGKVQDCRVRLADDPVQLDDGQVAGPAQELAARDAALNC